MAQRSAHVINTLRIGRPGFRSRIRHEVLSEFVTHIVLVAGLELNTNSPVCEWMCDGVSEHAHAHACL